MKRSKNVFLSLLAVLTVVISWGTHYFYHVSIGNKRQLFDPEDSEEGQTTERWFKMHHTKRVTITSEDGKVLVGHYIAAKEPTTKTVIVAHGYNSYGKAMIKYAMIFNEELGYNILLPDARGHGESEGKYIGFGWHERQDYLKWINYLIEANPSVQIALFGISMGGATVMMVSGEKLPKQVKAIIEDCGYTSVDEQLAYQLKVRYHLPIFPFLYTTSFYNKLRNGYDFFEASAVNQVRKATVPMMFIHGDKDTFVPAAMVYPLFKACGSKEKELWIVKGAAHGRSYKVGHKAYVKRIATFLDRYMK